MERRTISLPDGLDGRMRAVQAEVNWSGVACRAFEIELGEIVARKEIMDMESVKQRLKASRLEHDDESFSTGFKSGKEWAGRRASYAQLKRLSQARDATHDWSFDGDYDSSACGPGECFYFIIEPGNDGDREMARGLCETVSDAPDEIMIDGGFVNGFAQGAMEIFGAAVGDYA